MGLGRCCAVFVGIACLAPGSAWADHLPPGQVTIGNDRTIHPLLLDVNPGETVTWRWVGPDTNHTTTSPINGGTPAEVWESDRDPVTNQPTPPNQVDHNVNDTFPHTFTVAGTYLYGCRVHDTMRANVRALGIPTARITASPASPLTDQDVTFNAGASFDGTSGTIVNYEWDVDGNATNGPGFDGFELDTDGVSTTIRSYPTASPPAIAARVRVTDAQDTTAIATLSVTVRSRVPVASFNVSANPQKGQPVTFTSSSTDADNDPLLQEWDLDNDGLFGVDDTPADPTGPTAQRTYAVGPHTVGLRVTDDDGTSSTTRTFTVANQAPTAFFTATPGTVLIGETVNFDGTASSDVLPGGIVSYAWDLDGDNVFEIAGANATPSRSYSSVGTVTTRLRVTDDDGGTNTTTRTVTVNAPPSNPPPQDPPPAESPPPVLPAPSVSGGSSPLLPPALTLRGPAKQRALRQRGIIVTAGCDRACALAARGTVNVPGASKVFRLRQASRSLPAAGSVRFKLALPRAAQTAIRRALRARKRVTATITVAATDAAGTGTKTRRVTLIG